MITGDCKAVIQCMGDAKYSTRASSEDMPCVQVFVTQQYLAIAMEYAAGGDMFEHVVRKGGLKESEARWFFQQLLVGVDYVHRMVSLWSTSKQWLLTYGESQGQHQQLILPGLMLTPQSHKLLWEAVSV